MNNTNTIKLFDSNNKLIDNYDKTIEMVLKDIHGDNYYDIDEDYTKKVDIPKEEVIKEIIEEKIEKNEKKKISIKDFLPVLFFILIFVILIIGGYYFLNNFDLTRLIK